MQRLRKIQRNAQIARYGGISPVVLAAVDNMALDKGNNMVSLAVALGALENYNSRRGDPWMRLNAIPHVANLIALDTGGPQTSMVQSEVLKFGTVVPVWTYREYNSRDHKLAAQDKILNILRSRPPKDSEVVAVYSYIKKLSNEYKHSTQVYTPGEVQEEVQAYEPDTYWPDYTNKQYVYIMRINGHWLPSHALADDNDRLLWQSMITPAERAVDPTALNIRVADNFADIWRNFDDGSVLAYYEVLAELQMDDTRNWLAAAALLHNIVLTKGQNVTGAYLEKRATRLEQEMSVSSLTTILNPEIVSQFALKYPTGGSTPDEIYRSMIASYTLWGENALNSLQWSIEQACGHNIAAATALASVITRTRGLDIEYLMRVIPTIQFVNVAKLAAHVIYDPFCSIINPPVLLREYADLGFIGTFIDFFQYNPGKTANAYKGKPESASSLPYSQLVTICNHIKDTTNAFMDTFGSPDGRLKELLGDVIVESDGDDLYVYTFSDEYTVPTIADIKAKLEDPVATTPQPSGSQAGSQNDPDKVGFITLPDPAPESQDLRDLYNSKIQQQRSAWPRRLKNLPPRAARLTMSELQSKLLSLASPRSVAFQQVMEALHNAVQQRVLNPIKANHINGQARQTALPIKLIDQLVKLGVGILPEWRVGPPDTPEILVDNNAGLNYILYYRPRNTQPGGRGSSNASESPQPPPSPPLQQPLVTHPGAYFEWITDNHLLNNYTQTIRQDLNDYEPKRLPNGMRELHGVYTRLTQVLGSGIKIYDIIDRGVPDYVAAIIENLKLVIPSSGWSLYNFMNIPSEWMHPLEYEIINQLHRYYTARYPSLQGISAYAPRNLALLTKQELDTFEAQGVFSNSYPGMDLILASLPDSAVLVRL